MIAVSVLVCWDLRQLHSPVQHVVTTHNRVHMCVWTCGCFGVCMTSVNMLLITLHMLWSHYVRIVLCGSVCVSSPFVPPGPPVCRHTTHLAAAAACSHAAEISACNTAQHSTAQHSTAGLAALAVRQPVESCTALIVKVNSYQWHSHCNSNITIM